MSLSRGHFNFGEKGHFYFGLTPLYPSCIFFKLHATLLLLVVPRNYIGADMGRGFFPKDIGTMWVRGAGTDAAS